MQIDFFEARFLLLYLFKANQSFLLSFVIFSAICCMDFLRASDY